MLELGFGFEKALQMNPEESHVLLIGDSENDPNVYSFVSQLLKQGRNYVSIINGGFNVCLIYIFFELREVGSA